VKLPDRVSAIVFDCDGLLVDTEPAWSVGEAALYAANGLEFGPEQKRQLIGTSVSTGCEIMAAHFGRPGTGSELVDELFALVEAELLRGVAPMPGVVELLDAIGDRVPIAVASNSNSRFLEVSLGGSGLASRFAVTVGADDVAHHKPAPDLYLEAFRRLHADPKKGVGLEDSATGMASVRASGAFVFAVPSTDIPNIDADFVAASLADPAVQAWAARVQAV
jgi:HAD superfamily hydrolase (TIGR01509 family)